VVNVGLPIWLKLKVPFIIIGIIGFVSIVIDMPVMKAVWNYRRPRNMHRKKAGALQTTTHKDSRNG